MPSSKSFRVGATANVAGQLVVGALALLTVPLLLKMLGTEAFGLVAFFIAIQGWIALLDLGLGQVVSRQSARLTQGGISEQDYMSLFRGVQWIFLIGALFAAATMTTASGWLATSWFQTEELPTREVQVALVLLGVAAAVRWWSGVYRAVITGNQRFVWLAGFNVSCALGRYVLVFAYLAAVGATIVTYFQFQVLVAIVELAVSWWKARQLTAVVRRRVSQGIQWMIIRRELVFAFSLSFSSIVFVLTTQTDRLVLSRILPLPGYGVFGVAISLATSIVLIVSALGAVILPRLSALNVRADDGEFAHEYFRLTRIVATLVFPVAGTLAVCAYAVLLVWTGESSIAEEAAPVVTAYVLGNGLTAVTGFAFYLQFARGDLKLHVIASIGMLVLLVPSQVVLALKFGAVGAGWAWFGLTFGYLVLWIPVVHHRFLPGIHTRWLLGSVVAPAALVGVGLGLGWAITVGVNMPSLAQVASVAACSLMGAAASWFWLLRGQHGPVLNDLTIAKGIEAAEANRSSESNGQF